MGGVHGRHSYSGEWGPTRGWPDTSGMSHLSAIDHADLLATMFGIDPTDVAARHSDDPTKAVATDVELLRSNLLMPRDLVVSGLVYDVDTGSVETIIAPAPLGS